MTGIVGGPALGALLSGLTNKIDDTIDSAEQASKGVIIQAGSTLNLAIQNIKTAYEDSLEKTIDELNPAIKGNFDMVNGAVQQFEKHVFTDTSSLLSKSLTIINTIPGAEHRPQVENFSPKFIIPSPTSYEVTIEIRGSFFYSSHEGYSPYINFNNKIYKSSENTTQSLKFQIPSVDLITDSNILKNIKLELIVPYIDTHFLVIERDKLAKFDLLVGTLPDSPGEISIVIDKKISNREVYRRQSRSWEQYSNDNDITQEYRGGTYDGWEISDPEFVTEWAEGVWHQDFLRTSPEVTYRVTTIHKSWDTSGHVKFHFACTISRGGETIVPSDPETMNLKWGESKVYNAPAGSWTIKFKSFDGKSNEYKGPVSSSFLVIQDTVDSVAISINNPSQSEYSLI